MLPDDLLVAASVLIAVLMFAVEPIPLPARNAALAAVHAQVQ